MWVAEVLEHLTGYFLYQLCQRSPWKLTGLGRSACGVGLAAVASLTGSVLSFHMQVCKVCQ